MNNKKNNFSDMCALGLVLSFIPIILLALNSSVNIIFASSSIVLLINVVLFIRVRRKASKQTKSLIYSSLSIAMSVWAFLHCLYVKYTVAQEFTVWLLRHGKGMTVFNSAAFSFFVALFILLLIASIEVFQKKEELMKAINYMLIVGSSVIIIMYVFIFPDIIISEAKIKLKFNKAVPTELIAERSYGELFNNGKYIEGWESISYEWYHNDTTRISNGKMINQVTQTLSIGATTGTFQVFASPPAKCDNCEKIESAINKIP